LYSDRQTAGADLQDLLREFEEKGLIRAEGTTGNSC
jgi:hypothetical protein